MFTGKIKMKHGNEVNMAGRVSILISILFLLRLIFYFIRILQ